MWFRSPEDMLIGEICGSVELSSTEACSPNLELLCVFVYSSDVKGMVHLEP